MPEKKGVVAKVAELAENVSEFKKFEQFKNELEKANVNLDRLNEDLELLEQASPKVAEKIKKLALSYIPVLDENGKFSEDRIKDLQEEMEVAEKKLDKWYTRWVRQGKDWFSSHITEISAAALATNALNKAMENTRSATDHIVQTVGDLNTGWVGTIKETQKLGKAISDARVAAAGYGVEVSALEESTRRYYDLFQTTSGIPETFKGLAALSRTFNAEFGDLFTYVEKRQREFGKTSEESTEELGRVLAASEDLNSSIDKMNATGKTTAKILRSDFYKVVKESSEELSDLSIDMGALASVQGKALEYAKKLGLAMKDSLDFAKNTAKALKMPDIVKFQTGEQLASEFKKARDAGVDDQWLKSFFGGKAANAKEVLEMYDQGRILSRDAFMALSETAQGTESGLKFSMKMMGDFLQKNSGGAVDVAAAMLTNIDDPMQKMLVAKALLENKFGDVEGIISNNAKELALNEKERQVEADKNKAAAKNALGKAEEGAKVTIDAAKDSILGYLADPVKSLGASLALLAGQWGMQKLLNRAIIKQIGGAELATLELAAVTKGAFSKRVGTDLLGDLAGTGVQATSSTAEKAAGGVAAAGTATKVAGAASSEASSVTAATKVGKGGFKELLKRGLEAGKRNKGKIGAIAAATVLVAGGISLLSGDDKTEKAKKEKEKRDREDREEAFEKGVESEAKKHEVAKEVVKEELNKARDEELKEVSPNWQNNFGDMAVGAAISAPMAYSAVQARMAAKQAAKLADSAGDIVKGTSGVLKATDDLASAGGALQGAGGAVKAASKLSKFAKRIPFIGAAIGVVDGAVSYKTEGTRGLVKSVAGTAGGLAAAGAGAAAGAAIGSVVPVAGTIIGGIIGAGVGVLGGWLAENAAGEIYDAVNKGTTLAAAEVERRKSRLGRNPFVNPSNVKIVHNAKMALQETVKAEQDTFFRQIEEGAAEAGAKLKARPKYIEDGTGDMVLTIENPESLVAYYRAQLKRL